MHWWTNDGGMTVVLLLVDVVRVQIWSEVRRLHAQCGRGTCSSAASLNNNTPGSMARTSL